jgi:hypothetical protein
MGGRLLRVALTALACVGLAASVWAQSSNGTIRGSVLDQQGAITPGATVTVRNVDTNFSRSATSDESGQFFFSNLPTGNYELTVELGGFQKYVRSGITLAVNQDAVIDVLLQAGGLTETVEVAADASILNTTTPEVGVRFDTKRIAELPVGNSRDVYSLALNAPGVNQLSSGQGGFAAGVDYAANGMRVRSNNFMVDGQDSNDPSVTGRQQPITNTEIVQEIRLITNQFAAEFGRAAGSVMNVVTKSGTNVFHGSGFVFHNNNEVNSRSNLDKNAGRDKAPYLLETQFGGTLGGPVVRDRVFFFGGYQRWTRRSLGSGFTLNGAATEEGRRVLESAAGSLPQVQALLKYVPAAQTPLGRSVSFTRAGQSYSVPIGSLTGSSTGSFNSHQPIVRGDVLLTRNHTLSGRYMNNIEEESGAGQVTPPGLTTVSPANQHATNVWLSSVLSSRMTNEFRVAHQHLGTETNAADPSSEEIPSLELAELGMTGFNAGASRTAIGLAVNLPQYRFNDTIQVQNVLTYVPGNHVLKFGADIRKVDVKSFFVPTIRGRLSYPTLQRFIDDVAEVADINKPLPGGQAINYYNWWDSFFFAQDEWRLHPSLTLSLGVRYELPGNSIDSLVELNESIVETAGGDPRYALAPVPEQDTDNWQPRVGFNWNPQTSGGGMLGWLTGGNRLVVRGGYARTHDYAFLNLALNVASSFPFVAATSSPGLTNAFTRLPLTEPTGLNPQLLTRTVVAEDFRSPLADQYSLEIQRELTGDMVVRVGYVGTQGKGLFQTLDGNPTVPFRGTTATGLVRQDPTRGVIRLRANAAESSYHSLQIGLDKRLSKGLSAGAHYTWSEFVDTASDTFNTSAGEVAVAQDSYNLGAERAPSAYDRPHRFTTNFVWELPFAKDQSGFTGRLAGGWMVASTLTLQSGAPFTPLNGIDPTGALAGISGLVGNAIRPNVNTDLDLSGMTVEEILAAGGASLYRPLCGNPSATCAGERVGDAGRNSLRADGIGLLDFAFIKNTRIGRGQSLQFRVEMFNATNTRNFGIPEGRINAGPQFLNQWGTDGGNREIWGSLRYSF